MLGRLIAWAMWSRAWPPMTLRKSTRPRRAYSAAMATQSSCDKPSASSSSPDIRIPTTNSSPTASRIASSTSMPKRIRFSRLPP